MFSTVRLMQQHTERGMRAGALRASVSHVDCENPAFGLEHPGLDHAAVLIK
jgi:hypothetical protein